MFQSFVFHLKEKAAATTTNEEGLCNWSLSSLQRFALKFEKEQKKQGTQFAYVAAVTTSKKNSISAEQFTFRWAPSTATQNMSEWALDFSDFSEFIEQASFANMNRLMDNAIKIRINSTFNTHLSIHTGFDWSTVSNLL